MGLFGNQNAVARRRTLKWNRALQRLRMLWGVLIGFERFKWWACSDLNRGPTDYESGALTS